jgi:hypothetical protein
MLSSCANVIIWDEKLSSGMKYFHLGRNVIIWSWCYHLELMLSSGRRCYHLGCNVIIWDEMLSFGMKCYHLVLMLSSGMQCYHLELCYQKGTKCYHLELMLWYGAKGVIWNYCYHLVLSCDVIIWDDNTPLFIFPENFTHSSRPSLSSRWLLFVAEIIWLALPRVSEVSRKNKKGTVIIPDDNITW